MSDVKWSDSEKRVSRRAFDAALQRELTAVMAEFKQRAASAREPEDIWNVETYLTQMRKEIDSKYDYRYSQLLLVFGRLLREGWVDEHALHGLSEDKLEYIRRIAAL
jgi:hypothetical protein